MTSRVVMVTRETEFERLIANHATRGQAEFFLASRGQSIDGIEVTHRRFEQTLHRVMAAIPPEWRRNRVRRSELDRFLFEPRDLVVIVGQDGLVANVAKYLHGQRVIGVNPDQSLYDGILVPFASEQVAGILVPAMSGEIETQSRTMVKATLDDGQQLLALNEIFLGHRGHQSARYLISNGGCEEHQSSSGIIVATGTGATGWARSIDRERRKRVKVPLPEDERLAFYVREAFPSVATGTSLTSGLIDTRQRLHIRSEMNDGGVIFGDGIEADNLQFNWGRIAELSVADQTLDIIQGTHQIRR